ncbi:MAG: hypothetical protein CMM47_01250 [Rhodospirillaceae bacterium]|nr:hypothetical protein [Rhodospirillaceae bacterium]|tara:strand:- start:639 stop:932 length:294 start_codon:yes stop_codon:yes gene_type:complete
MKTLVIAIFGMFAGAFGYLYFNYNTLDSCEALTSQLVDRILEEQGIEQSGNFVTNSLARNVAKVPAKLFIQDRTGDNLVKCAWRLTVGGFQSADIAQ